MGDCNFTCLLACHNNIIEKKLDLRNLIFDKKQKMFYSEGTGHEWSDCTIQQFKTILLKGKTRCFSKPPKKRVRLLTPPRCGNHLVENGEDCDCGDYNECTR